MKKIFQPHLHLLIVLTLLTKVTLAQTDPIKYTPEDIIDEKYGIVLYEPLNIALGSGDTLRNDQNGYAANGYQSDFYSSGQLLHKGFYADGLLRIYKNYYPNGNVERNFKMIDLRKSKMMLYYNDGTMKSDIVYVEGQALKWSDYYTNGTLEYVEEYHKSFQYYKLKANYFENGAPSDVLELTNKKKLIYTQTHYHTNNQIKEQGELKYNKAQFDYEKIGKWIFYDENGKPIKEQSYASGKLHSEKDL